MDQTKINTPTRLESKTLKSSHEGSLDEVRSKSRGKRKKRRRRRRGQTTDIISKPMVLYSPTVSPTGNIRLFQQPSPSYSLGSPTPVLRPVGAQVPRAPENSTQFIMDDHENSFMYFGFDGLDPTAGGLGVADGPQELKNSSPMYKYTVADFESEYRLIREEAMTRCTTSELKAAIVRLEARAAVLSDALSASPSRLLERLQSELLTLQEENKSLQSTLQKEKQKRLLKSSSSSSDTSDTDSSTSESSNCTHSECEECMEHYRNLDEEKENTSPKSVISQ